MNREDILEAINKFCESNKSRQRSDLYDFLNIELDLDLGVYNYNGTNDHARFACDEESQQHETDHVLEKLENK